jgi:hypothetical protein
MAQTDDDYDSRDDVGWFRDELRQRDRLIAEHRQEQDEANDLIRRFREHADDYDATLEGWCETFGMELTDKGWTWKPFWDEYAELHQKYYDLVRRWNRAVPILNAGLQDVGRPLAVSEAQVANVMRLHKAGRSLRWIVEETSLSLRTVRTIIERKLGTDRTTKARREKIEIDKFQRARWKSQKRTGDALPKRVNALIETGNALVTEAKGLGR